MRELRGTRAKKRRMRRRIIRQLFWRSMVSLLGILILLMTWNLTSCALRYFSKEEALAEDITENMEKEEGEEDAIPALASAAEILLVNKDHPLPDHYPATTSGYVSGRRKRGAFFLDCFVLSKRRTTERASR